MSEMKKPPSNSGGGFFFGGTRVFSQRRKTNLKEYSFAALAVKYNRKVRKETQSQ
jgi:hypothetical protein